jgi:hypothetical protein
VRAVRASFNNVGALQFSLGSAEAPRAFWPDSRGMRLAPAAGMDANDARYELPCRVMLAIAAVIHWVYAGLAWREMRAVAEPLEMYATVADVLSSLPAFF